MNDFTKEELETLLNFTHGAMVDEKSYSELIRKLDYKIEHYNKDTRVPVKTIPIGHGFYHTLHGECFRVFYNNQTKDDESIIGFVTVKEMYSQLYMRADTLVHSC